MGGVGALTSPLTCIKRIRYIESRRTQAGWRDPPGRWTEENPERLALGAETRALIEAAIAALPEGQRAVIVLRDVEGVDAEEACRILALSEANQRVLLHRARTRVREALHQHLGRARPC